MPSRACDACLINYPDVVSDCRVCGNTLRYSPALPSHDWDERSRELADAEPVGGPVVDVHPVKDQNGRLWLYVAELHAAGYHSALASFDRFVTDEGLLELQGYDAPRSRWWVVVL
jgi:hypothetical protein